MNVTHGNIRLVVVVLEALKILDFNEHFLTKNSYEVFEYFCGNLDIGNMFAVDVNDPFLLCSLS